MDGMTHTAGRVQRERADSCRVNSSAFESSPEKSIKSSPQSSRRRENHCVSCDAAYTGAPISCSRWGGTCDGGTMRAEMRKSLLHEGTGPAVLTAFVELVFDNTDRRLPIDKDDVRVRRTVGVKKDDYMLDGKHATKAEVFNLLESCGFTKSNPYYIVQQGKVSELTLMNDLRRLELLKEISGASVYDERRAESEKILEDVRARRQKAEIGRASCRERV